MLILCWNLAGRVGRLSEQADLVLDFNADIVCLQELSASTLSRWLELLNEAGYRGIEHAPMPVGERPSALAVMTAARDRLQQVPVEDVPWPERVLAVCTGEGIEIVNVHSPISSKPELAKVRTHQAVYRHLAGRSGPRVLCGDLNTPRREHSDGTAWTFARDRYGRLIEERGEEWDEAELSLIKGLQGHGFRDGFLEANGTDMRELSWEWPRWGGGYRLDHLICAEMSVEYCHYEHSWRELGLSDHSPLIARLRRSLV
jgi:exonuclease III